MVSNNNPLFRIIVWLVNRFDDFGLWQITPCMLFDAKSCSYIKIKYDLQINSL